MWTSDGLGNAYNTKTEDTIYLNTPNVGYVESAGVTLIKI